MNCKYIYLIFFNKVPKMFIKSTISLKKSHKSLEIVGTYKPPRSEKEKNEIIFSLYIFI
jgi:hypothetical protein